MASLVEVFDLTSNSVMLNKVTAAVLIAAEAVRTEAPTTENHANRLIWAAAVFAGPRQEAQRMWWAVLAANAGASVEQIQDAPDTAIQENVNAAIDLFATGG